MSKLLHITFKLKEAKYLKIEFRQKQNKMNGFWVIFLNQNNREVKENVK